MDRRNLAAAEPLPEMKAHRQKQIAYRNRIAVSAEDDFRNLQAVKDRQSISAQALMKCIFIKATGIEGQNRGIPAISERLIAGIAQCPNRFLLRRISSVTEALSKKEKVTTELLQLGCSTRRFA
jgi:hypothetical protein